MGLVSQKSLPPHQAWQYKTTISTAATTKTYKNNNKNIRKQISSASIGKLVAHPWIRDTRTHSDNSGAAANVPNLSRGKPSLGVRNANKHRQKYNIMITQQLVTLYGHEEGPGDGNILGGGLY